jgi:hypothetical protein
VGRPLSLLRRPPLIALLDEADAGRVVAGTRSLDSRSTTTVLLDALGRLVEVTRDTASQTAQLRATRLVKP